MGENWEIARINNLCGFFFFFSVKGQRNEGGEWGQRKCLYFKIDGIIVLVC